jgi:hypothetical protein
MQCKLVLRAGSRGYLPGMQEQNSDAMGTIFDIGGFDLFNKLNVDNISEAQLSLLIRA